MESVDSISVECSHTCLLSKEGGESGLNLHKMLHRFLQLSQHMLQPEPSTCLLHNTVPHWGHWAHVHCIWTLPSKYTLSRPQKVTVSLNL